MRVLVIGGSGQVGTELARRAPAGWQMQAPGRDALDLANPGAGADWMDGVDMVINAAAWTAVDAAETHEDQARRINAEAPAALARAAAVRDVPFVHVSTDYVYDGSGTAPFGPEAGPAPLNAYGRTKLAGDRAVMAAGGRYAILRTSWVFSAHGANFVKTMLRLAHAQVAKRSQNEAHAQVAKRSQNEAHAQVAKRSHNEVHAQTAQLRIVADQVGGPTWAGDIADALIAIATAFRDGQGQSGVYHFAGAPDVSWAGFAREILRQAGIACAVEDIPTSAYPTPARRPANSRLDCRSTETVFNLARPDWRVGLGAVLKELHAS